MKNKFCPIHNFHFDDFERCPRCEDETMQEECASCNTKDIFIDSLKSEIKKFSDRLDSALDMIKEKEKRIEELKRDLEALQRNIE